ncbi:MAG: metallophosphoesterase family protein [Planctomycetota bacterium]
MRRFLCAFLFPVVFLSPVRGQDKAIEEHGHSHAPAAAKPADVYRPTVLPDRVVLSWTGDPATSQAVTWRTSTDVKHAVAQVAVASGNPAFTESAWPVEAATQSLKTDLGAAHFHTAQFTDLKPATKYAYRVGDGKNWSEWFHFRTAHATAEPFSFIYFGDAQNNIRSMWSRVIREAYSDAPKASFFLHAGDLINRAESDAEWGEWFGAGGHLNAMTPSLAVPGNHEQAKQAFGARRLSHHWRPTFAFPENGPEGLKESCYTLVYQGVRFVCLNSNTSLGKQAEWLEATLAANEEKWVVCTFHHPVFSTGGDRDNPELRRLWKPILDKHRVDIVLQGHDHTYGRTGLETPVIENVAEGVTQVDVETGTVYVVSVSGPKMYPLQRHDFMKKQLANTQLYQIIHIEGDKLRYEARTAIGEVYDAFELAKRPGEINQLTELVD